jgi:CBS-domain-containing membrane protein
MAVRYHGHMVRTRQQAGWLAVALSLAILALVLWRFTTHPPGVALPLGLVAMAPFATAYQTWRFLGEQERVHAEPTAEMSFVFRFLANTPLTFGALIFLLLIAID